MNTLTSNENVFVFLFRCEKCQRPIVVALTSPSPQVGGDTLQQASLRTFPLECVKSCGWTGDRVGAQAAEIWSVPWNVQRT
jgi:hypothetical protein